MTPAGLLGSSNKFQIRKRPVGSEAGPFGSVPHEFRVNPWSGAGGVYGPCIWSGQKRFDLG